MQPAACSTPSLTRHTLGMAISMALLTALEPAMATGLVAIDGPMGTALVDSQTHAPVIAIVAPNAQGLSHNRWQDYNVGAAGVVLNNSLAAGQASVGGLDITVAANPQLVDVAARTILNEVVGTRGSRIDGEQVIFGQAADYVLSNPNGIELNGAHLALGQHDTATYVVGTAVLADGAIARYDTRDSQQRLVVGQAGVNVGAGSVQLIAPSVMVSGDMTAGGDLSLLMGRQQVDARTLASTDTAPTQTAVDANLLGAMHARRIKVISTQAGAGVTMGITGMHAAQGIQIASAGALAISSTARQNGEPAQATLDAGDEDVSLSAASDLTLTSLAVTGRHIDARSGARLKLDALAHQTETQRPAHAEDHWFTLAQGEADAHVTERTLRHVGNDLIAQGRVRLDGVNGIDIAASRIAGPEHVGIYTVRGGVEVGAELDTHARSVRLASSESPEDNASTYVERANTSHISGGSVTLPSARLVGARIDASHSLHIGGSGATHIAGLELRSASSQGADVRRVTLTETRAHEAARTHAYQLPTQLNALDGELSIRGTDISISGSRLSAASVGLHSQGNIAIEGSSARMHLEGARPSAAQAARGFDRTSTAISPSVLAASGTLALRARRSTFRDGDISIAGSHLLAGTALTLDAQDNVWISGIGETEGFTLSGSHWSPMAGASQRPWNRTGFKESQARSTLAGDTVQVTAGTMLDVAGSELGSKGDIKLQASDIQLTASLEPAGPRNRAIWLDNDLPEYHFVSTNGNARTHVTDRVHNGFAMKAGGDIDISALRLATHAASVNAAGRLTIAGSMASFKDTPVLDSDAIRSHYHGYIPPRRSSWQAPTGLPLAALDVQAPSKNGTTRESAFVAGTVGADTAHRIRDLNIPLSLR